MKKIMFNDKFLLTQAVLRGDKTQTRRIVKDGTPLGNFEETIKHASYKVGEIVAVAQCYKRMYAEMIIDFTKHNYHLSREENAERFRKHYENTAGWDNKMFVKGELMPHKIKITNVRIERLQDISDEDCLCKGIAYYIPASFQNTEGGFGFHSSKGGLFLFDTAREASAALIDKVSGKGTWESNPYVWVYDFELVKE